MVLKFLTVVVGALYYNNKIVVQSIYCPNI